jgi:hypothetical protein
LSCKATPSASRRCPRTASRRQAKCVAAPWLSRSTVRVRSW